MTFPEVNAPERTDLSFKELLDEGHHTRDASPQLNVGLVSPSPRRISGAIINAISDSLVNIRERLLREFSSKVFGYI